MVPLFCESQSAVIGPMIFFSFVELADFFHGKCDDFLINPVEFCIYSTTLVKYCIGGMSFVLNIWRVYFTVGVASLFFKGRVAFPRPSPAGSMSPRVVYCPD